MHCDVSVCSAKLHFPRTVFMQWTLTVFVFGTWMNVQQCWSEMLWSEIKLSNFVHRMTRGVTDIAMPDILKAINTTWRRLVWQKLTDASGRWRFLYIPPCRRRQRLTKKKALNVYQIIRRHIPNEYIKNFQKDKLGESKKKKRRKKLEKKLGRNWRIRHK
jgi:hypothetical protein